MQYEDEYQQTQPVQQPVAPAQPPAPPAAPSPLPREVRALRGGAAFGVWLIIIGGLLLVAQFVPGVAWWSMWPAIIIAIGFMQMVTPAWDTGWGLERISDGIGTVILGVLLLGNTTGYIGWGMWWTLLTLWPVLLVSIGVRLLGKASGQSWLAAASPVLIWAAMAYAASTAWTGAYGLAPLAPAGTETTAESFTLSEPVGMVRTAKLTFDGGAAEINVQDGSSLAKVTGSGVFGEPGLIVDRDGAEADVVVSMSRRGAVVLGDPTHNRLTLDMSRDVLWDAVFKAGASRFDADLSDVPVRDLKFEAGASAATIKLGDVPSGASEMNVDVKIGASSVRLLVPEGADVRVDSSNGLASTTVPDGFVRRDDRWESESFGSGAGVINIDCEAGLGSVAIETY